jgi:hypothetical protein
MRSRVAPLLIAWARARALAIVSAKLRETNCFDLAWEKPRGPQGPVIASASAALRGGGKYLTAAALVPVLAFAGFCGSRCAASSTIERAPIVASALALPMPEVDRAVRRSCTRSSHGGVVGASIAPGPPVALSVVCVVGHVQRGPTDECVRNCSYDVTRTLTVPLRVQTVHSFARLGCMAPASCTQGLLRGSGYPLSVALRDLGPIRDLDLDQPTVEIRYADGHIRAWLLERRGGRLFAWAGAILPVRSDAGTAGDAALFVSRRSFLLPSLRIAMTSGFGCDDVRLLTHAQLTASMPATSRGRRLPNSALLKMFDRPPARKDC